MFRAELKGTDTSKHNLSEFTTKQKLQKRYTMTITVQLKTYCKGKRSGTCQVLRKPAVVGGGKPKAGKCNVRFTTPGCAFTTMRNMLWLSERKKALLTRLLLSSKLMFPVSYRTKKITRCYFAKIELFNLCSCEKNQFRWNGITCFVN